MISFSLLFPLFALATDLHLPAAGSFHYSGFRVTQKRVTEVLDVGTEEGRARVQTLRDSGATCLFANANTVRCTKFADTKSTENEVAVRVNRLMMGTSLKFAERAGEPSLAEDGETYQSWSIPQQIVFRGRTYASYLYQVLRGENEAHKLYLGDNEGLVVNTNGYAYVMQIQRQVNRNLLVAYLVEADFR